MTILDGAMAQLAQNLLGTFGGSHGPAVVDRAVSSGYDPDTREVSTVWTAHVCKAVVEEYHAKQIDGTLIKAGDKRVLIARLDVGFEPTAGKDRLRLGQEQWEIIRVESDPVRATYSLQVRR